MEQIVHVRPRNYTGGELSGFSDRQPVAVCVMQLAGLVEVLNGVSPNARIWQPRCSEFANRVNGELVA